MDFKSADRQEDLQDVETGQNWKRSRRKEKGRRLKGGREVSEVKGSEVKFLIPLLSQRKGGFEG